MNEITNRANEILGHDDYWFPRGGAYRTSLGRLRSDLLAREIELLKLQSNIFNKREEEYKNKLETLNISYLKFNTYSFTLW